MEQKQKVAYLKALIYIAAADDTVQDSERAQFTELGKLYGLTNQEVQEIADSVIKKEESLESILAGITDRPIKLLLLYDLLAICYADNNYSIAEKNTMKTIAALLEIEGSKLTDMENVMTESVELHKKINKILEK